VPEIRVLVDDPLGLALHLEVRELLVDRPERRWSTIWPAACWISR
jgi:hypothetical protein